MNNEFIINENLQKLIDETELEIKGQLEKIDKVSLLNSMKVLKAFQDNNI